MMHCRHSLRRTAPRYCSHMTAATVATATAARSSRPIRRSRRSSAAGRCTHTAVTAPRAPRPTARASPKPTPTPPRSASRAREPTSGIEPETFALQGARSRALDCEAERQIRVLVSCSPDPSAGQARPYPDKGLPSCGDVATKNESRRPASNRKPPVYKTGALPIELRRPAQGIVPPAAHESSDGRHQLLITRSREVVSLSAQACRPREARQHGADV